MTGAPKVFTPPGRFASFAEYFTQSLRIVPPPPVVIPWKHPWRIAAPEFLVDDDDEAASPAYSSSTSSEIASVRHFTSFGEYFAAIHPARPIPSP